MRLSVSNIGLSPFEHGNELERLPDMGFTGLEVAPSRVWQDTWRGLGPSDVSAYRRQVEQAGLDVVGLHSLLFDHPELGLFDSTDARSALFDFFVHLSGVCRDLGGKTLIWGGGRRRGPVALEDANSITIEFFSELAEKIGRHHTCFCLEPLAPADTDYVNSVLDSHEIVCAVDSPSLRVQIDAKALAANGEMNAATFSRVTSELVHFHANEPGFEVLGTSGLVDHVAAGTYLRDLGYDGFVSLEQKMIDAENPLDAIGRSAAVMLEAY